MVIIKKLFGTIGGIVLIVLLLLIVNQIIIANRLYQSEKHSWGREVTDALAKNIDSFVSILDPQLQIKIENDTGRIAVQSIFSCLDSLVKNDLPENLKSTVLHYYWKGADEEIGFVFPDENMDTTGMISTFPLLVREESLLVYFDLPFTVFWERYWQQLQGIFISFLLLLFFLIGIFYLSRRQRRLSALQEGMMQQIIHDFNTPLNSISTLLELVRVNSGNKASAERQKKYNLIESELNNMRRASSSLLGSLSQICDAAIEKRMFNLKEGITLLMEEQQWANRDKKEIHIQLDYRIPVPMIYASPVHLFCVIRNLLDNAVKYSDGIADITIRCYIKGNGIEITISDKGKGISTTQQRKIFMKYYRGEDRKKRVKGFGLGLAYVKKIIKAHGGKVWVRSEPGKGSTFGIRLDEW